MALERFQGHNGRSGRGKAIAAVREKGPVRLIAGGKGKGDLDLGPLCDLFRQVKTGTIGEIGEELHTRRVGRRTHVATLDAAVTAATVELSRGEQLFCPPAATSWDQFENYERRGGGFQNAGAAVLERRRST